MQHHSGRDRLFRSSDKTVNSPEVKEREDEASHTVSTNKNVLALITIITIMRVLPRYSTIVAVSLIETLFKRTDITVDSP